MVHLCPYLRKVRVILCISMQWRLHLESEDSYALMEAIAYPTIVQRKYRVIHCIAMQKDI